MINQQHGQRGFTVIELMIATSVFSVILLVCAVGLITVGRYFYKGVTSARTQAAARDALDKIVVPIKIGKANIIQSAASYSGVGIKSICVDNKRFSYLVDSQVDAAATFDVANHKSKHALWQDIANDAVACVPTNLSIDNPSATPGAEGSDGSELIPPRMRLGALRLVSGQPISTQSWTINIQVAAGEDDILERDASNNITGCKSITVGGQFCAVASLQTNAYERIK